MPQLLVMKLEVSAALVVHNDCRLPVEPKLGFDVRPEKFLGKLQQTKTNWDTSSPPVCRGSHPKPPGSGYCDPCLRGEICIPARKVPENPAVRRTWRLAKCHVALFYSFLGTAYLGLIIYAAQNVCWEQYLVLSKLKMGKKTWDWDSFE